MAEPPRQPRQPKDMPGLLKFCMEATGETSVFDKNGHWGHFDVLLWSESATARCSF